MTRAEEQVEVWWKLKVYGVQKYLLIDAVDIATDTVVI